MKRQAPAFTLLEMIVVLAIAALIIGIGAGAVRQMSEDHELKRAAHEAEQVFVQAMTRTLATSRAQDVRLEELTNGFNLTVQRAGTDAFAPVAGQHVTLCPGGLCEPLTLRWQHGSAWISAVPDPLTGAFIETEENL